MPKTIEDLSAQLAGKFDELAAWKARQEEAIKASRQVSDETKNALASLSKDIADINAQMDAIAQKAAPGNASDKPQMSFGQQVIASDAFQAFRAGGYRGSTGTIRVMADADPKEVRSNNTAIGADKLVEPQRLPGIFTYAPDAFVARTLIAQGRTNSNAIEYVRETEFTNNAAPVAEGALKPESAIAWEKDTASVRTIAHWIPASKQILEDDAQLLSYLEARLVYGLGQVEEEQLLVGDGTGENLKGLYTAATAKVSSTWNIDSNAGAGQYMLDVIARAALQVKLDTNYGCNGFYINPMDAFILRTMKDANNNYCFASPANGGMPMPWGLRMIESAHVPQGNVLIGAFNMASQVFDRTGIEVAISDQDRDNFVRNMLTIRVEERLALVTYRPKAIIKTSISAS